MIQRIQSVWLLLAALCNASLFYFDIYRADVIINGVAATHHLRINDHYPSLLVALVTMIMPLAAIFMFKKRKQQRTMVALCLVFTIGSLSTMLMRVTNFNNSVTPPPSNGTYWVGAVLPVIAIIFLILAIRGINKDEKLVKSLDRLR